MSQPLMHKYQIAEGFSSEPSSRCVNLVYMGGNCVAMTYGHLIWANFDSSKGMQAHFATHTVTFLGRNLRPIYDALLRGELAEVVERDEARVEESETETIVTKIHVVQVPNGTSPTFSMPSELDHQ